MFKKTLIALSAVAGLGLAAPGFAHPPQCDDDKSWQHCRDAQAAYLQRLNSDNEDLFHRSADDRFSRNDSDDRYFRSAAGDLYYRNPADERYYRVDADDRFYQGTADSRYYSKASDGRYYRANFNDRDSRSTKCVYFNERDGRFYQKNCQ